MDPVALQDLHPVQTGSISSRGGGAILKLTIYLLVSINVSGAHMPDLCLICFWQIHPSMYQYQHILSDMHLYYHFVLLFIFTERVFFCFIGCILCIFDYFS